ncbi:hypothetical protein BGZ83_009038 [Gryganskiella cystojenkinii]|nr:hypothetical protein BGZ83_009038 [Gryganskiella cystojenkinii]
MDCRLYSLESGLYLLTRMQTLRFLRVSTALLKHHQWQDVKKSDFAWIQDPSGEKISSSASPWSLASWLWRGQDPHWHRKQIREDYQSCLDRIQALLKTQDKMGVDVARDATVSKQQEENRFKSDYDRPVPMVDGLEVSEFSGSFVDMAVGLRALIHRFDQENLAATAFGAAGDLTLKSAASLRRSAIH